MDNQKFDLAKKKVKAVKNWYVLIVMAVFGTVLMVWLSFYIKSQGAPEFVSWIFRAMPLVWWIIVVIQGLNVNNKFPKPLQGWEERQIKKFMQEEGIKTEKYR